MEKRNKIILNIREELLFSLQNLIRLVIFATDKRKNNLKIVQKSINTHFKLPQMMLTN